MRPVPVDIEPLALQRVEGKEMILASRQPIAALIRPGPDSRTGDDSFGFELPIPTPTTELRVRAMAYLMCRTLRRSGIRWAIWRPVSSRTSETSKGAAMVTEPTEKVDAKKTDSDERATRPGESRGISRPGETRAA